MVSGEAARLENLVAMHLLKFVHFQNDALGHRAELFFLRDRDGREVDFLICIDRKPWFAVEVKSEAKTSSKHLHYFRERIGIPHCYQLTSDAQMDRKKNDMRIMGIGKFLMGLA